MLKADVENDIDYGTFGWICSSCTRQKSGFAKQPSSIPQQPSTTMVLPVTECSPHVITDDPIEKLEAQDNVPKPLSSTHKTKDHDSNIQRNTSLSRVPHLLSHHLSSRGIPQRQDSSVLGSDSASDTSSWQDYVSPISRIREAINLNRDGSHSTTTTRSNSVQQDLRTLTPVSTHSFDQRADSLTRRISRLDVNVDDANITSHRKSNEDEKEARLLTSLLREELENEGLQSHFPLRRPVHTKCKAKRFRQESRKGIERVNNFANFYFCS